jgi:hypothetical protein
MKTILPLPLLILVFTSCTKEAMKLDESVADAPTYKLSEKCIKYHIVKHPVNNLGHTSWYNDTICDRSRIDTVRFK